MPRESLAQQVERWKNRVRIARDIREVQRRGLWEPTVDYYRTEARTDFDDHRLQVNFVWAWFESMFPSLTFNHPHVTCEARSETSVNSARTTEAAINGELRRAKLHRAVKKAVPDGLLCGIGIFHMGYYLDGLVPSSTEPTTREETEDEDRPVNSDVPYGYEPNSIYIDRIRPDRFLVDPKATCLEDALWVAHEYHRPIDLVKDDPQYKNTENLAADEYDLPDHMTVEQYKDAYGDDPEMDHVRLVQVWDIVKRRVYTINPGHDKFLRNVPWPYQIDRFPYYVMHMTVDPYQFYNQAPAVPWLPLQNEFNYTISHRLDHMSRSKSKMLYNKSMVDDSELEAALDSSNAVAVGVDAPEGSDLRAAFQQMPTLQLPPEHWAHIQEVRQRITEISGQSEFDVGGTRPGERPAAEIRRIGAGADIRRHALAERVTSTIVDLATDLRLLMQNWYSEERVIEITDDYADSEWVTYTGANLKGDYSFACNVEDLPPETRDERQQKIGMLLQMLTPYSQVGSPLPRIDIDPILRAFGKELRVSQYLRFLPSILPPMDPSEEWYLMAGKKMDLEPNDMDDHDYHLFTHQYQLRVMQSGQPPFVQRDLAAEERLRTHMERHETKKLAMEASMQGQQQVAAQRQAPGGGAPGPQPGSASNNPGGGAGAFAGNGPAQQTAGGAAGQNIQEVLRQGV